MKDITRIIVVLTLTCVVCALFLALVSSVTAERIKDNATKNNNDAITALAPLAQRVEKTVVDSQTLYKLFDRQENLIGYAFLAQGQGYAGTIKIVAVLDSGLSTLEGIKVVESVETPGLGGRIVESFFDSQFKGLPVLPAIIALKDNPSKKNEIKTITGATISSRAVVSILNKRIETIRKALQ